MKTLKKRIVLTGALTGRKIEYYGGGTGVTLQLDGRDIDTVLAEAWGDTEGEVTLTMEVEITEEDEYPSRGRY